MKAMIEQMTPYEQSTADAVYDPKQAAEFLKIDVRTLEGWRARAIGPKFLRYSSRCVRYKKHDLMQWLDSCAVDTAEAGERR